VEPRPRVILPRARALGPERQGAARPSRKLVPPPSRGHRSGRGAGEPTPHRRRL